MFQPEAKEHISAKKPELKGMKVLERNYVGLVMEDIRHTHTKKCNLGGYQKGKDFPSYLVFFSLPDPSRIWHSEGVSDDIRFLCINPLRPVINGGLLTCTLTGMSRLKEACLGSGRHQEALRNWD